MRNYWFVLVALFGIPTLGAQTQLGLRTGAYAGVHAWSVNPAQGAHSALDWDVNLAGAAVFFSTNYAYLENSSLAHELGRLEESTFAFSNRMSGVPVSDELTVVQYNDTRRTYRYQSVQSILGPAFSARINEQWSVAVTTAMRVSSTGVNVPTALNYAKYDERPFDLPFVVDDLQFTAMSWREIGVGVAHRIPTYQGSLSLGMTVKHLRGYEAGFLRNRSPFQMAKIPDMSFVVDRVDVDFGYTSSNLIGRDESFELTPNGAGFGLDLGVTYALEDRDGRPVFRAGAAVIDIGGIRFNQNAVYHRVRSDMPAVQRYHDYDDLSSITELPELVDRFISSATTRDAPTYRATTNAFRIGMPSVLHLQADVRPHELFGIDALLVQNLRNDGVAIRQASLLAVTPRFEHRWGAVAVPLSLYEYDRPRVGLALRAAYLVVGTDDLGSWLFRGRLSSADAYVALRLNSFRFGRGDGLPVHRGKRRGRRQQCYRF